MSIYRQGPAPADTCPRCREPLIVAPSAPSLRGCERCGGVFADLEASRRIVTHLDRVLLEIGFAAAFGKERKRHPPIPIACPTCLIEMQRAPIQSAACEVDACPSHGTWFDAGELEDVMRAFARSRKRGVPPPGSQPSVQVSAEPPAPPVANEAPAVTRILELLEALVGRERS